MQNFWASKMAATLFSVALFLNFPAHAQSINSSKFTAKPCPYNCSMIGLKKSECRDWRRGNTCYVQDLRSSTPSGTSFILCKKSGSDTILIRKQCKENAGESEISPDELKGETGDTGLTGATGAQGADGELRIYGDGSAGTKSISANTTLNDSNPQYTNFTVASGATLTVHSGTVIHCTGTFQNEGTITILPALRDQPRFSENGQKFSIPNSGGQEAPGGSGGGALFSGVAKGLLRLGLLGAGNGYRELSESGASGGGNFTVLCKGTVINNGTISANGSAASSASQGGGGGGFVILASALSVANNGTIESRGAAGGALLAADPLGTGQGPGGGGGGGIVHLIAPQIVSSGTVLVSGGSGGAAGGANAITGMVYLGGGGGGGAGGTGGDGGAINPGNIGNNSTSAGQSGDSGVVLQTQADPASLY